MEVPRHWRLKKQRYSLVGETCPNCASYLFPPRAICPICANQVKETESKIEQPVVMTLGERVQATNR